MIKMRPQDYLDGKERFIFKKIQEDIQRCNSKKDLFILEKALDELLKTSFRRYKKTTG